MEYGRILSRAVQVTWRHKVLWVFGIAIALFSGGFGGGGGMNYRANEADVQRWRNMPWGRGLPNMPHMPDWQTLWPMIAAAIGVLLLVVLVLSLVGTIVRYTAHGALITMVDDIESTHETTFRAGLNRGWKRFLRLLAIDLVLGIFAFLIVMVLLLVLGLLALVVLAPGIMMVATGDSGQAIGIVWLIVAGLGAFLVLLLVSLVTQFLITLTREYAWRRCLLDLQGVFAALGQGWRLLRQHLKESLVMWLLLAAVNLALGMALFVVVLVALAAMAGLGFGLYGITRSIPAGLLGAVPVMIVLGLFGMWFGGLLTVFQSSVWTLAFRSVNTKG